MASDFGFSLSHVETEALDICRRCSRLLTVAYAGSLPTAVDTFLEPMPDVWGVGMLASQVSAKWNGGTTEEWVGGWTAAMMDRFAWTQVLERGETPEQIREELALQEILQRAERVSGDSLAVILHEGGSLAAQVLSPSADSSPGDDSGVIGARKLTDGRQIKFIQTSEIHFRSAIVLGSHAKNHFEFHRLGPPTGVEFRMISTQRPGGWVSFLLSHGPKYSPQAGHVDILPFTWRLALPE